MNSALIWSYLLSNHKEMIKRSRVHYNVSDIKKVKNNSEHVNEGNWWKREWSHLLCNQVYTHFVCLSLYLISLYFSCLYLSIFFNQVRDCFEIKGPKCHNLTRRRKLRRRLLHRTQNNFILKAKSLKTRYFQNHDGQLDRKVKSSKTSFPPVTVIKLVNMLWGWEMDKTKPRP